MERWAGGDRDDLVKTTSPEGVAFVKREEGCVYHVYPDEAGIPTGGVGHVIQPGDPAVITPAIADAWLIHDLARAEGCVNTYAPTSIGQNMFDALVSLGFNIGVGAERVSSVMKTLEVGGYLAAADHFLDWCKISKGGALVVSQELLGRRKRERDVFLRDVSTLPDDAA